MSELEYKSIFAPYLHGLVEQKRALAYEYAAGASAQKRLDTFFLSQNLESPMLCKELVLKWCAKTPHETIANQNCRIIAIRQLAEYMHSVGAEAYVYPKNSSTKAPAYVPHIFTFAELKKIFEQADKSCDSPQAPYRHLTIPLLFRILYGCGLRISEATNLKVGDVDLEKGVLTIRNSKFDKDRLVPLSHELQMLCTKYFREIHSFSSDADWWFLTRKNKQLGKGTAYTNFRKILKDAGISHGGKGIGPRLHDFRHTFAVHCLKGWVLENKNLQAYLPVLKTYLGHNSFAMTARYLRLTADVYPDLVSKIEQEFGDVIPMIGGEMLETD